MKRTIVTLAEVFKFMVTQTITSPPLPVAGKFPASTSLVNHNLRRSLCSSSMQASAIGRSPRGSSLLSAALPWTDPNVHGKVLCTHSLSICKSSKRWFVIHAHAMCKFFACGLERLLSLTKVSFGYGFLSETNSSVVMTSSTSLLCWLVLFFLFLLLPLLLLPMLRFSSSSLSNFQVLTARNGLKKVCCLSPALGFLTPLSPWLTREQLSCNVRIFPCALEFKNGHGLTILLWNKLAKNQKNQNFLKKLMRSSSRQKLPLLMQSFNMAFYSFILSYLDYRHLARMF